MLEGPRLRGSNLEVDTDGRSRSLMQGVDTQAYLRCEERPHLAHIVHVRQERDLITLAVRPNERWHETRTRDKSVSTGGEKVDLTK